MVDLGVGVKAGSLQYRIHDGSVWSGWNVATITGSSWSATGVAIGAGEGSKQIEVTVSDDVDNSITLAPVTFYRMRHLLY